MNKTGSPPPTGSKNEVLKLRSVKSIVNPAASTGMATTSKNEVIITDTTNKVVRCGAIPSGRILAPVVTKLILAKIDDIPAMCSPKIINSKAGAGCPSQAERGGYNVHPVPTPSSTSLDIRSKTVAAGSNQNLRLFNRANTMSGAASKRGTAQLPKKPIIKGITMKKIISSP